METPLGNALARMPVGAVCAVGSVLECPECGTVYPDQTGAEWCGPCGHIARYTHGRPVGLLKRRSRRPDDDLSVSFIA